MKNTIAKKIGLSVDEFIIKKSSLHNSEELKDLSVQLMHIGILNRGTLFLSLGTPQAIDEFLIEYRLCSLSNDNQNGLSGLYDSELLARIKTSTSETVLERKQKLIDVLFKEKNISVQSAKCIRLRERYVDYKNIMRNTKKLKDYSLYDKKVIGVTVLDHEEDLEHDELLLCLKFWDSNTK